MNKGDGQSFVYSQRESISL